MEKSPVRVCIETYFEEAKAGMLAERVREVLIDTAKVATEQELDRCLSTLRKERPILSRTNNWNEILKR